MIIQDKCYLCGEQSGFQYSDEQGTRYAVCRNCGALLAESDVAHMLVKYTGGGDNCLNDVSDKLDGKKILNIDFDGKLDEILRRQELYTKSRKDKKLREYANDCYDIVISQHLLDEVSEIEKNIAEIDRIMDAQGVHIFLTAHSKEAIRGEGKSFIWNFHEFDVIATHKKMSDISEYSGERFVPGIEDKKLAIEHMQRYRSVSTLVAGKKVIDIACGEGYGTAILAERASEIVGMDIDEGAVHRASEKYQKENLKYQIGNITSIPAEDHSVDVVVSFETIEHVSQKLQAQFLNECGRVLKEDGILIMSTPNKEVYSDRYNYFNEYHIHEFYHDEFVHFLKQKFKNVKMYNQAFQVASILSECENTERTMTYYADAEYDDAGKYYIAIASNKELSLPEIASVYMSEEGEYEQIMQRILKLQIEEEKRNIHIQKLDEEIAFDRKRIVELQDGEERRNRHIAELDQQICSLENDNGNLTEEKNKLQQRISILEEKEWLLKQHKEILEEKSQILEEKRKSLEEENSSLKEEREALEKKNKFLQDEICSIEKKQDNIEILQNSNEQLKQEKQDLSEQFGQERQDLIQQIRNKEGHIELLLESEREFERYKQTRGYRATLRRRKIVNAILPPNSKRLFILRVIKRMICNPGLMVHVIRPKYIGNYIKYLKSDSIEEITDRYDELINMAQGGNTAVQAQLQSAGVMQNLNIVEEAKELRIEDYEMLCFTEQSTPIVSIVIPVYNQFDYTYNCLKSILKNSGNVSYEILIANDCSTDITKDIERVAKNVRLITTESNVRFLLNCNNAAKYAKGQYILFLNNDTQVMENWLQPLVDVMERDETVGMVGSKLIYPDGRLQEAGGILWKDASAWNYGHLKNPDDPDYAYLKETDYVSGAAIMIRTSLWKEIGGFDERFVPAYCEDSDLAFEVRKHGYKVMMQPKSVVVHFEGISNGTDVTSGQKKYQVENQKKFYEKWKDELEQNHFPNGQDVFLARDRGGKKKHILVIDHYVPQYDKDAGSKTTYMYLKMLVGKGYRVTFLGDNFYQHEPYTSELQQMGIFVLYGLYYAEHWKEWLKENIQYFDIFYLNRPHITVKYIDFIKKNAKGKVIYYGHDLHFLRIHREYELDGDEKKLEESEQWKKMELDIMHQADMNYYPSVIEKEAISKIDSKIPVKAITAYVYEKFLDVTYHPDEREGILFVGGFGHTPNLDAVKWFLDKIYPEVFKNIRAKFYIVGSKAPDEITHITTEGVVVKGFVSEEELQNLYSSCKMVVVPLRYGAGVKGKVVEALYYGMPIVTTSVGAEGIEGIEDIAIVKDREEDLIDAICSVYHNGEKLIDMSEKSQRYVREKFSTDAVWNIIKEDFE